MEHIWLNLEGISSRLRFPAHYIRQLTKQGYLVTIGKNDKQRWLDPTPEYAERLRLAAILHSQINFVPPDISEASLLTLREVAFICGWTLGYARLYMQRHKEIPRFQVNSQFHLFSVSVVRDILWRRQGRGNRNRRSPFLLTELIKWVQKQIESEEQDIPTDAQYVEDDLIMRKLEAIVRRSERDQSAAKNDLASKMALARKIVEILESATPKE